MANKINPKFYQTVDEEYVISIEDISLIKRVQVNNEWDSYFLLYMKGSSNGIQLTYRDGLNIINILSLSDNCKMYFDIFSASLTENYYFPKNMYEDYRVTSLSEMQTGTKLNIKYNESNKMWSIDEKFDEEHKSRTNNEIPRTN